MRKLIAEGVYKRWWVQWVQRSGLNFITAEGPCWKGQLQIGRFCIGWQADPR